MPATIASVSHARRRVENPKKSAPLTSEQKEKVAARADKQTCIDTYVQKWMEDTNELANTLGKEFDMKPRYFLDIFFQGGAHMINHQEVTNPYNVFKSFKAAEAREAGESKNAAELHHNYFEAYTALTSAEKAAMVKEFETDRTRNFHLHHDTLCAKVQDVANIVRNMKMLMFGLGQCMEPEWYFTSRELENYMEIATRKRWVTGEVGMKLEAFAIAGCDPVNMLRTSGQKVNFMKSEIHSLLTKNLADVSRTLDARIGWTWFEEDVVQKYGVKLIGWTAGKDPVDPSSLSTSQSVIRTVLEVVRTGECQFQKLGPIESAERRKKWEEDVAAGQVTAKHYAPHCDAGQPRKRTRDDADEEEASENDENDENDHPRTNGDGSVDGDDIVRPPPKKQARTTKGTSSTALRKTATSAPAANKKSATKKPAPAKPKKAVPTKKSTSGAAQDDSTTCAALTRLKES
ncbi:hypothetical protein B0H13DRAFT_2392032, partial [Mycena leptocephala]